LRRWGWIRIVAVAVPVVGVSWLVPIVFTEVVVEIVVEIVVVVEVVVVVVVAVVAVRTIRVVSSAPTSISRRTSHGCCTHVWTKLLVAAVQLRGGLLREGLLQKPSASSEHFLDGNAKATGSVTLDGRVHLGVVA